MGAGRHGIQTPIASFDFFQPASAVKHVHCVALVRYHCIYRWYTSVHQSRGFVERTVSDMNIAKSVVEETPVTEVDPSHEKIRELCIPIYNRLAQNAVRAAN